MITQAMVKQYSVTSDSLQFAKDHADSGLLSLTSNNPDDGHVHTATGQTNQGSLQLKPRIIFAPDQTCISVCSCGAWYRNKRTGKGEWCMHTLALGILVDGGAPLIDPATLAQPSKQPKQPKQQNGAVTYTRGRKQIEIFQEKNATLIGKAVADLAGVVEKHFQSGSERILLLVGGTGTGKTSAIRAACRTFRYNFVFFSGDATTTLSTAFGIKAGDVMGEKKEFHKAFELARQGENTVLFVDEMLRLDPAFRDGMMKMVQAERAGDVRKLISDSCPIPDDMDDDTEVYVGKSNYWPMQWCPKANLKWVFATNPWGHEMDAAFSKRCHPVWVRYAETVIANFSPDFQEKIKRTWEAYDNGQCAMPIEYTAIKEAESPSDDRMFELYLDQLRLVSITDYAYMAGELGMIKQ